MMQTRDQYDDLVEHQLERLYSRIMRVKLPPIAAVTELRECLASLTGLVLKGVEDAKE